MGNQIGDTFLESSYSGAAVRKAQSKICIDLLLIVYSKFNCIELLFIWYECCFHHLNVLNLLQSFSTVESYYCVISGNWLLSAYYGLIRSTYAELQQPFILLYSVSRIRNDINLP